MEIVAGVIPDLLGVLALKFPPGDECIGPEVF